MLSPFSSHDSASVVLMNRFRFAVSPCASYHLSHNSDQVNPSPSGEYRPERW